MRQSLAFQGDQDEQKGNSSCQLVKLISRWVPSMEFWLPSRHSRPYQVLYTCGKSQNEFISIFGQKSENILVSKIKLRKFFAVMADTTPDESHVDQISFIIRYVDDNYDPQERLVKISEIRGKTGREFAEKLISMLKDLDLPTDGIRFQCYDTTNSMSGEYNGAQANLSLILNRIIPYTYKMYGAKSKLVC